MRKRGDKRGQVNWYLIISLILGIMILIIVVYWIFQEYFSEEDMDWETCRQAVVLRTLIPANYFSDLKEAFQLRCRTSPFVIKTKDVDEAAKQVADISARCFYVTGEGKVEIFERDSATPKTYCIICARISIDSSVRQDFSSNKIPIWAYLRDNKINGESYLDYFYSDFVDHPFVSKECPGLKSDSIFIKEMTEIPDYWQDPNKDMYVTILYLNKGKVVFDSLPMGFGKLPCSNSFWPSGIYQSDPPLYGVFITQDLNKLYRECTHVVSIPK